MWGCQWQLWEDTELEAEDITKYDLFSMIMFDNSPMIIFNQFYAIKNTKIKDNYMYICWSDSSLFYCPFVFYD